MNNNLQVGIVGTGFFVPEKILTNADLEKIVETSDEWITTRTGFKERHILGPNEVPTSNMGTQAALRALTDAGIQPMEVDLIICCTATPDMLFPATACIIQKNLEAKNAAAFDLEAGCTGFLYGLSVGTQFVKSGMYKTVLVVGADSLTRVTNWEDRSTCVLFGDGAGAAVLRPVDSGRGIMSIVLGADGTGDHLLTLPAGGSLKPASHKTVDNKEHYIQMQGREVFKFAAKVMETATVQALAKAGVTQDEVGCFIAHQANLRIIEAAAKRLNLPRERVFINGDKYGNTSCGSIAIALDEAAKQKRIKKGDILLLVAFGAGLTWASMVLEWGKD